MSKKNWLILSSTYDLGKFIPFFYVYSDENFERKKEQDECYNSEMLVLTSSPKYYVHHW